MRYENPRLPEGINVTPEHPLKEFTQLLVGIALLAVLAVAILAFAAERLAQRIPFEMELQLASQYRGQLPQRGPVTESLQALAERLAVAAELPPEMKITVHYVDDKTVNAMATLGGNIVVFRGLLEKMPNENALAMVLAHEIAHIRHRHPVMALGRGVVIGLTLAAIGGFSGNDITGRVLGDAGLLTVLSFNRAQEAEADRTAVAALARHYGHVAEADAPFRILQELADTRGRGTVPGFLNTHPASTDRIEAIRRQAREHGWSLEGARTPLPPVPASGHQTPAP